MARATRDRATAPGEQTLRAGGRRRALRGRRVGEAPQAALAPAGSTSAVAASASEDAAALRGAQRAAPAREGGRAGPGGLRCAADMAVGR